MAATETRTALLLMDYQVALCEAGPHARLPALVEQVGARGVIDAAATILNHARGGDAFVAHVRLAFDPTYTLRTNRSARFQVYPDTRAMLADSPEAQIVEKLRPAPGEPVVDKGCVDPFVGTPLLTVLRAEGVGNLVLGGVATNLVVESAARHAADAGFQVTVVEDMCASFSLEAHSFAVNTTLPMFADVRSSTEVAGVLA